MSEAEKFAAVLREEALRRVGDRYVHHAVIRTEMREMADRIVRWERMEFDDADRAADHEALSLGTPHEGGGGA